MNTTVLAISTGNILLIIGLIVVVGGIIALFVARKKRWIEKPKPGYDGNKGIKIPPVMRDCTRYIDAKPVGVPIWIDWDHPFEDSPLGASQLIAVQNTINRAAERVLALAKEYHPDWKIVDPDGDEEARRNGIPPITECHIYLIPPMAFNSKGQPNLVVTPYYNDGVTKLGPSVETAGTVLNVSEQRRPTVGNPINPFVVIPYWEKWDDMESLYHYSFNEFEHLVEIWVSWTEYFRWSGPNDVHEHRPDTMAPVGLMRTERDPIASRSVCAGAFAHDLSDPIMIQRSK